MKQVIFSLFLLTMIGFSSKLNAQCNSISFGYDVMSIKITQCSKSIKGDFKVAGAKIGEIKFKWQKKYKRYSAEVKYNYVGINLLYYPATGELRYKSMWQDIGGKYHWHKQKGSEPFCFL
jgi:hypothetical protein